MSNLFNYFTTPKVDSEAQLQAAQAKSRQYSSAQEAEARAHGFHNADEMVLFLRNRQVGSHQTQKTPAEDTPDGGFSLASLFPWHPANTMNIASDALRKANSQ